MQIIKLNELVNNKDVKIQVGLDSNNNPVWIGDVVYKEVIQQDSADYYNGYEPRTIYSPPSKIVEKTGKVYRKVLFNGHSFVLEHTKTDGRLPHAVSHVEWANEDNLKKYTLT